METVNNQFKKITSNPIGAIAGGILLFWATKKYANVSNKWLLAGVSAAGALIGANMQAKVAAKAGAPTAQVVKK